MEKPENCLNHSSYQYFESWKTIFEPPLNCLFVDVTTRHFQSDTSAPQIQNFNYSLSYSEKSSETYYNLAIQTFQTLQAAKSAKSHQGITLCGYFIVLATITATNQQARNRYPALMSVVGVVGGTYLAFVLLSPNKDGSVVSDEDRRNVRGGSNGQSPFGTKTARSPRSTAGTEHVRKG